MADNLSPEERSLQMSLVGSKNTKPEILVRRLIYSLGYRYRLHCKDIPGKPDIVFRSKKKAIFVHGCFWHRHESKTCKLTRMPKSNKLFWKRKFEENKRRDIKKQRELKRMGWDYLIIWECEVGNLDAMKMKIQKFLS